MDIADLLQKEYAAEQVPANLKQDIMAEIQFLSLVRSCLELMLIVPVSVLSETVEGTESGEHDFTN